MRVAQHRSCWLFGILLALLLVALVPRPVSAHHSAPSDAADSPRQPFLVVENAGQFDPAVRFQIRANGMTLWATDLSLWISVFESYARSESVNQSQSKTAPADHPLSPRRGVNLELRFVGTAGPARLVAADPRPTRMNYFVGSSRGEWRSGVRTYGSLTWQELYPRLSLTLSGASGQPALVIKSTDGDIDALRFRVAGAEAVRVLSGGQLVAETPIGSIPLPSVMHDGRLVMAEVNAEHVSFGGHRGSIHKPDAVKTGPAPGLHYSTLLGGSDTEFPSDISSGPDGSVYVAGSTDSDDFPTTPGAFDTTNVAGDAFVSKFDPTGSDLLYSTFLGGGSGDFAYSLVLGPLGTMYLGGRTVSEDFPTTPGAYDTTLNGPEAYVAQLDQQGAELIYSTFVGGTSGEFVYALALAADGTVHLTGETSSADFPTTAGAFDRVINDDGEADYRDAFAAALDPTGTDLAYGTFLGGRYNDYGYGVAAGTDGQAYVTGPTQSPDFPTTAGAFDETSNGGNHDVFVTKVSSDGAALVYSTYLGGYEDDDSYEIAVDPAGNAYVAGATASPNYPTTPGAFDETINSVIFSDVFATKLNPSGSALVYSTFLGGEDTDQSADLSLDLDGSLNLTGTTYSGNFPTTPRALDRTLGGCCDVFVSRLDGSGGYLLYSSFLGGTGTRDIDQGAGIVRAGPGVVALTGVAASADFPVTPGAYDTTPNGEYDAFVTSVQVAPTMHVDRIVPQYRPFGQGYQVGAAIRILYQTGSPVKNASVTVRIAYPDGSEVLATRPTGSMGVAVVVAPASDTGTYTFTVLNVARLAAVYDPTQNGETSDSLIIP